MTATLPPEPVSPGLGPVPATTMASRLEHASAFRDRELRSASGVTDLLARRPELRGVLPAADWLAEATLWSA